MSRITLVVLTALLAAPALAQDDSGFGLDLTEPDQKKPDDKDKDKKDQQNKDAQKAEGSSAAGNAGATPDAALTDVPVTKSTEPLITEKDITQEDRVKSVQRKVYLKRHRFELTGFILGSVNDPYYSKYGLAARLGYYLADTLSIGVRTAGYQVLDSDDVRTAKRIFQSQVYKSIPNWSVIGDLEWSPIYGKVTIFNSIIHFDAYLNGGLGVVLTATSSRLGPHVGTDLGAGLRFIAKDYLAINVGVVNTSYVDEPTGTSKGATQNMLTLNAGAALFFPLRSTGREAE